MAYFSFPPPLFSCPSRRDVSSSSSSTYGGRAGQGLSSCIEAAAVLYRENREGCCTTRNGPDAASPLVARRGYSTTLSLHGAGTVLEAHMYRGGGLKIVFDKYSTVPYVKLQYSAHDLHSRAIICSCSR